MDDFSEADGDAGAPEPEAGPPHGLVAEPADDPPPDPGRRPVGVTAGIAATVVGLLVAGVAIGWLVRGPQNVQAVQEAPESDTSESALIVGALVDRLVTSSSTLSP